MMFFIVTSPSRRLGDEGVFGHLRSRAFEPAQECRLATLIGVRTGRTRAEATACLVNSKAAAPENSRPRQRDGGRSSDQEGFRAEHIYPSVKFRRRSSGSNSGSTSAGGTKNTAATNMSGPGRTARHSTAGATSRRKNPPTGLMDISITPNPA